MVGFLWLAIGIAGLFYLGALFQKQAVNTFKPSLVKQLWYQPVSLVLAIVLVFLNRLTTPTSTNYLSPGDLYAKSEMLDWLGYSHANWFEIGTTFSLIALVITTTVVYFQVLRPKIWKWKTILICTLLAIPLSLVNSLTEELIFRIIPLESLPFSAMMLAAISAAAFGIPHYFGNPGKILGILLAGFLGYVAACSVIETKGIGWAWLIHFVQDVPIFAMLLI